MIDKTEEIIKKVAKLITKKDGYLCNHDFTTTKAVMTMLNIGEAEQSEYIECFEDCSAFCDCEVVINLYAEE